MKPLDETIFDDTGLSSLTPEQKTRMLTYVEQTLLTRVGIRLTTDASKEQLDEFMKVSEQDDDEVTLKWLAESFPNFQTIVEEELAEIKTDLTDVAEEVLNAGK